MVTMGLDCGFRIIDDQMGMGHCDTDGGFALRRGKDDVIIKHVQFKYMNAQMAMNVRVVCVGYVQCVCMCGKCRRKASNIVLCATKPPYICSWPLAAVLKRDGANEHQAIVVKLLRNNRAEPNVIIWRSSGLLRWL